jgi:hypothetical protein
VIAGRKGRIQTPSAAETKASAEAGVVHRASHDEGPGGDAVNAIVDTVSKG